jgi:hypothetical protein
LQEYTDIFDSIKNDFEVKKPNLTPEKKQAIISNVDFFRNPILMEK